MMAGELDLAASVCAHEMHASDPGPRAETVVCDLGALSFIDVSGVRVLVDAADYARGRGTRLAIVNVPPVASRVLCVLSLYERLATGTAARGLRRT